MLGDQIVPHALEALVAAAAAMEKIDIAVVEVREHV